MTEESHSLLGNTSSTPHRFFLSRQTSYHQDSSRRLSPVLLVDRPGSSAGRIPSPTGSDDYFTNSNGPTPKGAARNSMAVDGMAIAFRDVVVLRDPPLIPQFSSARRDPLVQQACGLFDRGTLNVILATNPDSGIALLSVLSGGRIPTTGAVFANGVPVVSSTFRKIVGFTGRHDAAVEEYTVAANVRFSAEMRSRVFSPGSPHWDNVVTVMQMMALNPKATTSALDAVGRLKLEIAMELVLDPPVLFLQNPLKNLAPHELTEVGELLRRCARLLGKTVIFTADSAPMPIYERIDSLVLLGGKGHTLYSGPKVGLTPYFLTLRLPTTSLAPGPVRQSSSLAMLQRQDSSMSPLAPWRKGTEVVSGRHLESNDGEPADSDERLSPQSPSGERIATRFESRQDAPDERGEEPRAASPTPQQVDHRWLVVSDADTALDLCGLWEAEEELNSTTTRYAAAFYDSAARTGLMKDVDDVQNGLCLDAVADDYEEKHREASQYGSAAQTVSFSQQRRQRQSQNFNFAQMMRDPPNAVTRLFTLIGLHMRTGIRRKELYLSCLTLFLLFGFAAWLMSNQSSTTQGMMNIRGIIFFMFWVMLELNIYFVDSMVEDIDLFLQHRDGDYYGTALYMFTVVCRFIVQRCFLLEPVALFVYLALSSLNEVLFLLGCCSFAHVSLLFLIVSLTMSSRLSIFVCLVMDAYMILFSGFLIDLETLPLAVAKTSLIRFGYGGAVEFELRDIAWACDAAGNYTTANATNSSSYCYSGNDYLISQGFEDDTLQSNTGQLLAIAASLLALAFIRLSSMKL